MPTETYYNLPEEKREKIRTAIHAEFSRVPYEEVSINRIVHEAQIPRGSFYQYFDGKEDMFQYLLQEYHDAFFVYAREVIHECGGDPFLFTRLIFDRIVSFIECFRDDIPYYRNLVGNMRFQDMHFFRGIFESYSEEYRELASGIDRSVFRDQTEEGIRLSSEILQMALQQSVSRILLDEDGSIVSDEKVRLEKMLRLIGEGIMKKEAAC